jgi:hypothetical protein
LSERLVLQRLLLPQISQLLQRLLFLAAQLQYHQIFAQLTAWVLRQAVRSINQVLAPVSYQYCVSLCLPYGSTHVGLVIDYTFEVTLPYKCYCYIGSDPGTPETSCGETQVPASDDGNYYMYGLANYTATGSMMLQSYAKVSISLFNPNI